MKYLYTCLFVLCGFVLSIAQPTFTITPSTTAPIDPGQTISFDVTVTGFTNIISSQFAIRWDPNVLSFVSIDDPNNINFPGFGASNFGAEPSNTDNGTFNLSWLENALEPIDVPDGTRMFSFTLMAVGGGTITVEVDPTATQEVIDGTFEDIGLTGEGTSVEVSGDPVDTATCNDGILNGDETGVDCGGPDCPACPSCDDGIMNGNETGIDCGGSCSPCNTGGGGGDGTMSLTTSSATVQPNAQVCLDVTTMGFTDLVSMQYSMSWNTTELEFDMVQNITTELTDFSDSNIGLTEVDAGQLRVSWNPNDASQGYSLADGTLLYQICFIAVGSNGTTANVNFTNTPLTIEVTDVDLNFIDPATTNGTVTIQGDVVTPTGCPDDATPFCMSSETGATINSISCVSITAQNFDNILSFQHSIRFDATNLRFESVNVSGNLDGLADSGFNTEDANTGIIRVNWFDNNIAGITLPDDTELYQLCFTVLSEGTHPVTFSPDPVPYEIIDIDENEVTFNGADGSISTEGGGDACSGVAAISISENSVTNIDCRGDDAGAIDINVSGGMGAYSFAWSDADNTTTEDLSGLTAGTYTVTVSAADCGDDQTMSFTITEPADGIDLSTNVTSEVMCFGETTGAIEATASGGTGALTFDWPDDLPDDTGTQSGLTAGDYTVTVTDDSGCAVSATVTVPGPTAALAADPMVQALGCGGQDDGSINLNLTGGTSPYTVAWNDSAEGESRTGLAAGDYTPTVTDANGCTLDIATLTIAEGGDALSIMSDLTSLSTGTNGAIDITVTGGTGEYTFLWTGPDGFDGSMGEDLSELTVAGDYTVQVTDGNSCTVSETFSIVQAQQILLEATIQDDCGNASTGSITLLASGGVLPYDYSWTLNDGAVGDNSPTLANVGAGTYEVAVTDGGGNTITQSFTIEGFAGVSVNAVVVEETVSGINDNGSITITATGEGTLSYTWADGPTEANRTELDAGEYVLTTTDENGCSSIDTFTVAYIPATPEPADYFTSDASCAGVADGSLSFTLTNGDPDYTIRLMQESGGTLDETTTLNDYNPSFFRDELSSGRYNVFITDANDLDTMVVVTIGAPEVFTVVGTVSATTDDVECNGRIDLTLNGGSGNESYLWSTTDETRSLAGVCPGQYSVTITDANGCTQVETFDLTLLSADAVTNPSLCPQGDATGNIDLNVNGGTGPFTFDWRDSENNRIGDNNTEDLMGVAAGVYTVIITEATNVSIMETFTVGSTSNLGVSVENMLDANGFGVSCTEASDALFIATGTGSGQYAYEWTDGSGNTISSDAELANVGAGIYELMVTDNQNCTVTQSVEVTEPTPLRFERDVLDIPCSGDGNGEVMLSVEGGVPFPDNTYDYTWSHDPDNNFSVALGLLGGSYTVTITDANNCTLVDSVAVQEPDSLVVDVIVDPFSVQMSGAVTTTISGGTGPFMYEWTDMETSDLVSREEEILDITTEVTLGLIVTDINGCTAQVLDIDVFNLTDCLTSSPVMTPNDDDFNEFFVIQCLRLYDTNRLEVYSRWGQRVFEQVGYDNTWNGRDMDGNPLPSGAYYFVFEYTDQNDNVQQQKGAITILNE